jgi:NADH-quinone oxidoreductase subunit H
MYLVAEYLHTLTAAMLIVILFLGGWHFWGLTGSSDLVTWPVALARIVVLAVKVLGVMLFIMVIRWSWPRFRFDQLMGLAWNVMLPLGLVNVVMAAVWSEYGDELAGRLGIPAGAAQALCGWLVLIGAWLLCTVVMPSASDNRPRRDELLLPELERVRRP